MGNYTVITIHNMRIPQDNRWTQVNQGNRAGVLHESKNINLETPGELKLSKKPVVVMDSVTDTDFNTPQSIQYYDGDYFVLTPDEIFYGALDGGAAMTELAGVPALTINSDMLVVYGLLYFTTVDNLRTYNGSTISAALETLTSGVPHPMCIFDSLPTYKLAIGDGNVVETIDASNAANSNKLTLPIEYQITTLAYRSGYLYVGTRHLNGGEAKIFLWNGSGANAQYEVATGASWVYSLIPYQQNCAFSTSQGQLFKVEGSSAVQIGAFPIYYEADKRWQDSVGPKIIHRGMVAVGDIIYLNVNGQLDIGFMPEMKSGLWVYDPATGLNHRSTFSTEMAVLDAALSVTDSVITISASHGMKTGDTVAFNATGGLSGIDTDVIYYVDVQSVTTLKLSKSRKSLRKGTYVTITGTADSGDQLVYNPNNHYGSTYNVSPGAVTQTVDNESPQVNWDSSVVFGGTSNNTAGASVSALMVFGSNYNVGSFTTKRIYSQNIQDAWQEIYEFIDGVDSSVDEIIVKARTRFEPTSPIMRGTWSATNVINTLNTQNDEDPFDDIEIGDELELVNGVGQGYSVHVKAIEDSTNTRQLTVDESLGTISSSIDFVRTNFKKITTITSSRQDHGYGKANLVDMRGSWVQPKFELRGFDISIAELELKHAAFKSKV
jgi:hypothetical protein